MRFQHVMFVLLAALVTLPAWALEARQVKTATDKAGNWIIEQYDVKEKAFKGEQGKDVATVAMVITALCHSPRDYKETNGPYISEPVKFLKSRVKGDGTLKDKNADSSTIAWVKLALQSTKNEKYEELIQKMPQGAITLTETKGDVSAEPSSLRYAFAALTLGEPGQERKARAATIAESLMKLQQKNGSFGDNLQVNALALEVLNLCYGAMK